MSKIKYIAIVLTFSQHSFQSKYFNTSLAAENWAEQLTDEEKQYLGVCVAYRCYFSTSGQLEIDSLTGYKVF